MPRPIRCVLLMGAAALLSAQAATAAPRTFTSIDPLVSLSALGTVQSRAAVCAAGAAAAAAGAATLAGSASTAQGAAPGCVLPVTAPAGPPVVGQTVLPPQAGPPLFGLGAWAIIPGLLGLLAVLAFLDAGDDDRDFAPVSPF